jgi:RND family efflux transporter MFP subunit
VQRFRVRGAGAHQPPFTPLCRRFVALPAVRGPMALPSRAFSLALWATSAMRASISIVSVVLAAAAVLAACGKGGGPAAAASAAASAPAAKVSTVLLLSPEDLLTVSPRTQASGPVITGSLEPEKRADLRAEVGALVVRVLKDNGEVVRKGELLVQLDDVAIRDSLASAREAVRASTQAHEQAERQVVRLRTLQAQGMSSVQALDDAEVRRNNAQSDLVAARARESTAFQQLQRTEVRAPFDGVVSERKVSAGDTAQVGKELVKVMDPRSLRFEGLVSADRMQELKPGQAVSFRVNGLAQDRFAGKLRRVDAAANATTRQVSVVVDFVDAKAAPQVAGLFAEGQVQTGGQQVLTLPEGALVRAGEAAYAWRVAQGAVNKVSVKLGERDLRSGEFPVLAGLAAGDRVLRNPGSTLVDGQKAEMASVPAPAAGAGSAAAAK